jgi:ATP-dependent helicase/nuclease subunit B
MALFNEECLGVYKPQRGNSKATVREYTEQLYKFLVSIDLCQKLENKKRELYEENKRDEGDACGRIFDKMVELFDKVVAILGDERITVRE